MYRAPEQPSHLLPRHLGKLMSRSTRRFLVNEFIRCCRKRSDVQLSLRHKRQAPSAATRLTETLMETPERDARSPAARRDRRCVVDERVAADAAMCRCVPAGVCGEPLQEPVAATLHDGGCRVGTGGGTRAALTRHVSAHALAGCRVTYDGQHVWTSRRCPRRPSRVAAGW